MDKITTKSIRNVALLGHGGSGKTSLCEAMLYLAKATERLGKTPEGNTVSDYDPEEIRRGFSLSTTVEPFEWQDSKINILDTPGYLDFTGEMLEGIRARLSSLTAEADLRSARSWLGNTLKLRGSRKRSSSTVLTTERQDSREFLNLSAKNSVLPYALCSFR